MARSWAGGRSWVGRVALTAVAAGALAAGGGLVGARPARAATATVTDATVGETPFVVPAGVTGVTVALTGAPGGTGLDPNFTTLNAQGGTGATARAVIAVTPGEVLFVEVGGPGGAGTVFSVGAGGVNGGGAGGQQAPAGGGGGASDIRTCSVTAGDALDPGFCATSQSLSTRLLVAGGGGGAGGSGSAPRCSAVPVARPTPAAAPATKGRRPQAVVGAARHGDGRWSGRNAIGLGPGAARCAGRRRNRGDEDGTDFGGGGGGGGGLFGGGGGGGGECVPHSTSVCGAGGGGAGGASGGARRDGGHQRRADRHGGGRVGRRGRDHLDSVHPDGDHRPGERAGFGQRPAQRNPGPERVVGDRCHFTITPAPASGPVVPCAAAGMGATGSAPAVVAAAVSGLQPATAYTVTLTASYAQGAASGATVVFTTLASSAITTTVPPTTTAPPTTTVPPTTTRSTTPRSLRISAVTESAHSWPAGPRRATIARVCSKRCSPAVGTTFRFTLSRDASVQLAFARARRGKPGHRPTWVAAGSLILAGHAAADAIRFDGRLVHGSLRVGSYRLTVSATARGRTVATKPLRFTIAPARHTA
jgi:hypothetical protein